jgi:desumoylating isopeptidase 1
MKSLLTPLMVQSLLYDDAAVKTSAASLVFNFASTLQKARIENVRNDTPVTVEDEDWEVEMVSAVIEAINTVGKNEDICAYLNMVSSR